MQRNYPFRNLVMKGGGVKAYAYIGAIEVLEQFGILEKIERVGGNSAGALMSVLLSFRLSAAETNNLFETVDYSRIASLLNDEKQNIISRAPKGLVERGEQLRGSIDALNRLRNDFGFFSNDYLKSWLQETIADQCQGNGRATFADFMGYGFRDLHIVATNLSTHRLVRFSPETTPKASVANAAVASSSIPFFYESARFDGVKFGSGDVMVDGGVISNYPLHLFDGLKYKQGNPHYDHGINWETLGMRLFTPSYCEPELEPITNLITYIQNLIESYAVAESEVYHNNWVDQVRTIDISNCGISTIDFDIRPGESKFNELVESGRSAAIDYLENYSMPLDRFTEIKEKFEQFLSRFN